MSECKFVCFVLNRLPSKCASYAWVVRGSRGSRAGRVRVANFNSRSGNTRVARGPSAEYILLLLSRGSVSDPRPSKKNIVIGVYRGKGVSPRWWRRKNFRAARVEFRGCLVATTNASKRCKTTTTDEDERRLQATSERRLYV